MDTTNNLKTYKRNDSYVLETKTDKRYYETLKSLKQDTLTPLYLEVKTSWTKKYRVNSAFIYAAIRAGLVKEISKKEIVWAGGDVYTSDVEIVRQCIENRHLLFQGIVQEIQRKYPLRFATETEEEQGEKEELLYPEMSSHVAVKEKPEVKKEVKKPAVDIEEPVKKMIEDDMKELDKKETKVEQVQVVKEIIREVPSKQKPLVDIKKVYEEKTVALATNYKLRMMNSMLITVSVILLFTVAFMIFKDQIFALV